MTADFVKWLDTKEEFEKLLRLNKLDNAKKGNADMICNSCGQKIGYHNPGPLRICVNCFNRLKSLPKKTAIQSPTVKFSKWVDTYEKDIRWLDLGGNTGWYQQYPGEKARILGIEEYKKMKKKRMKVYAQIKVKALIRDNQIEVLNLDELSKAGKGVREKKKCVLIIEVNSPVKALQQMLGECEIIITQTPEQKKKAPLTKKVEPKKKRMLRVGEDE